MYAKPSIGLCVSPVRFGVHWAFRSVCQPGALQSASGCSMLSAPRRAFGETSKTGVANGEQKSGKMLRYVSIRDKISCSTWNPAILSYFIYKIR